jgi:arylsulfatase A-like enzyme
VQDLKQRGLLDSTLVVWGGEFGRTPMSEGAGTTPGRNHHIDGYSIWLAGGGIKPGLKVGETDALGFQVTDQLVEIHDLHATLLHCFGLEHTKLTYDLQGRSFRLTDVAGKVAPQIMARAAGGGLRLIQFMPPGAGS